MRVRSERYKMTRHRIMALNPTVVSTPSASTLRTGAVEVETVIGCLSHSWVWVRTHFRNENFLENVSRVTNLFLQQ